MKTIKFFAVLIVLLVALVAGVLVYVFQNINELVKEAVETHGPQVTQTRVELRDVDIKLTEGSGELNNFVIHNPTGFDSEHFLSWNKIGVAIDPRSLQSEVIVLKNVVIDGINIKVEEKGFKTNIQAMLKNLPKSDASSSGSSDGGSAGSEDSEDILLALERLDFKNNAVEIITENFGKATLKVPSFELSNLGSADNGLTPEELGEAILRPLLKKTQEAVEERIKGLAAGELEAKLRQKKEELEAKLEEKKEELKQDVEEKKEELKEDVDQKKEELKEDFKSKKEKLKEDLDKKEDELKKKKKELKEDAEEKLKNFLNR